MRVVARPAEGIREKEDTREVEEKEEGLSSRANRSSED